MMMKVNRDEVEILEPTVEISLNDYDQMRIKAEHFENIVKLAFSELELSWDKKAVYLNTDAVTTYIKALFLERCDLELKHLRHMEGLDNE